MRKAGDKGRRQRVPVMEFLIIPGEIGHGVGLRIQWMMVRTPKDDFLTLVIFLGNLYGFFQVTGSSIDIDPVTARCL